MDTQDGYACCLANVVCDLSTVGGRLASRCELLQVFAFDIAGAEVDECMKKMASLVRSETNNGFETTPLKRGVICLLNCTYDYLHSTNNTLLAADGA